MTNEWKDHPSSCTECPFLQDYNGIGGTCALKHVRMTPVFFPAGEDNADKIRKNCFDRIRPGTRRRCGSLDNDNITCTVPGNGPCSFDAATEASCGNFSDKLVHEYPERVRAAKADAEEKARAEEAKKVKTLLDWAPAVGKNHGYDEQRKVKNDD
jgi:hypothetical protein